MKRGGGRRYYRPEDISLLLGIKHLLYSDGLTIKGAQKSIQTNGVKATSKLGFEKKYPQNKLDQQEDLSAPSNDGPGILSRANPDTTSILININSEPLGKILSHLEEIRDRIKIRSNKKIVAQTL